MLNIPFSKPIIMSVLAFVTALGGYGGYTVMQDGTFGASPVDGVYTVVKVSDGDTFEIDNGETVRLIGIDAPEPGECYGEESRNALSALILDMQVELRKDSVATDKYGRLLRYAYLHNQSQKVDSIFINKYMIEHGYAKVQYFRDSSKHHLSFAFTENKVKEAQKGMWGECDYDVARITNDKREDYYSNPDNPECIIKGNISDRHNKSYFTPDCSNYNQVKVEEYKGEAWFCTVKAAKKAGYTKSSTCK